MFINRSEEGIISIRAAQPASQGSLPKEDSGVSGGLLPADRVPGEHIDRQPVQTDVHVCRETQ